MNDNDNDDDSSNHLSTIALFGAQLWHTTAPLARLATCMLDHLPIQQLDYKF